MDFQGFLTEKLKEKGLNFQKLSQISGIALKHLENLNAGNLSELPPAPYLRGYFKKIGEVLEFDGEKAWKEFRFSNQISTSGPRDSLPQNRFAKKSGFKKTWILAIIAIVVVVIIALRLPAILGQPQINIIYPDQELTNVTTDEFLIRGEIKGGDKLIINNEDILISDDGSWQKKIFLQPGLNTIEFSAKKFLGRETSLIRRVLYEKPIETTSTPENLPTKEENQ